MTQEMMRALVVRPGKRVGIESIPKPVLKSPDDAIIRTTCACVCSSDCNAAFSGFLEELGLVNRALGHEAMGIVEQVGENVKRFKVGDRVLVGTTTPCWKCDACMSGHPEHCQEMGDDLPVGKGMELCKGMKFINFKNGNMAEYFHVNNADANMALVPDSIPDEIAIHAAETMEVGYGAVINGNIPLGGTVAVFAQGPIGLMATAMARNAGAGLLIAVESDPYRQELAKEFGADIVVDFSKVDAVEEILRITDGAGVDTAIEALGNNATLDSCVKVTKPGGTVSIGGWFIHGDSIVLPREAYGNGIANKTIIGSFVPGGRLILEKVLRMLENKRINPEKLATHVFDFDDAEEAFELMYSKKDHVIKPVIKFPTMKE